MDEREIDRALERLFAETLALTAGEEAVLWSRLQARAAQDGQAWAAFRTVMLGLRARLAPPMQCLLWPARFVPAAN